MSTIEIIATLFSIACVVLTIMRNVWCWATGIVGVLAYMVLFYQYKLYADMGLQVVYLVQSIYGWYHWSKYKDESQAVTGILTLTPKQGLFSFLVVIVLWLGVWALLYFATDGDIPQWDALATAISLTAQGLLAWKFIENWLFWIVADILLVVIFIYKDLYLSAGTYMLFLVMAVIGWLQWKRNMIQNATANE